MNALDLSGEHDDDEGDERILRPDGDDEAPKPKQRGRSRRKTSRAPRTRTESRKPTEADLRKRIEEGLAEVIAFVEDRLLWPDVADVMREDRTKMAEVLAARGTKHARLGAILNRVFGKDSALSIARAFGPTLRAVGARLNARREERAGEVLVDGEGWVIDRQSGERTGERAAVA